jgi:hypothetical protein
MALGGQRLDGFQVRREAHGRLLKARIRWLAVARQFQQTLFRQRQSMSQAANRRRGNVPLAVSQADLKPTG